jgi:O-antigen/teichoic acid export membrane protein
MPTADPDGAALRGTSIPLTRSSQVRALRGTVVYMVSSLAQRGLNFLLLPFFALALAPADFGEIAILTTLAGAVGAVVGFGLETAIFRSLVRMRDDADASSHYLNTVGLFALVAPGLTALIVSLPLGLTVDRVFGIGPGLVTLALVSAALMASTTAVCFSVLRARERLTAYIALSFLQLVLAVGLPVWLVLVEHAGVAGWIAGNALAVATTLPLGLAIAGHRYRLRFDRRLLLGALGFGVPMVPHALAHWGLSLSDRVVLGTLLTNTDVGVYHVAYQFGLPIALVAAALAQATQPFHAEASLNRDAAKTQELRRLHTYVLIGTALMALAVALIGPPLFRLMLPDSYEAGAALIPWVALGTALFGFYFVPMNVITILAGRNRWAWVITVIAAVANIGLNFLLVPVFGLAAAAVDTVAGYGILLLGVTWYAKVSSGENLFESRRITLGMLAVAAALPLLLLKLDPIAHLVLSSIALACVSAALFALRVLPRGLASIPRVSGLGT